MITRAAKEIEAVAAPLLNVFFKPDELIEFVGILESGGKKHFLRRIVLAGEVQKDGEAVFRWMETLNRKGYGIHFGLAPRFERRGSGKNHAITDEDLRDDGNVVRNFRVVCVDLDGLSDQLDADHRAMSIISEHGLPRPTATVWSGGGLHIYWVLDVEITGQKYQRMQKALAQHFDSDEGVCTLGRTMRLPGTINPKPARPDHNRVVQILNFDPNQKVPGSTLPSNPKKEKRTFRLEQTTKDFLAGKNLPSKGSRKKTVYKIACNMKACGYADNTIAAQVTPIAARTGLPDNEIEREIASACSRKGRTRLHLLHDEDGDAIVWNDRQTRDIAAEAVEKLKDFNAENPMLFLLKGSPVHLADTDKGSALVEVKQAGMQHYLGLSASWYRQDGKNNGYNTSVPAFVAQDLLVNPGTLPLPPIEGVYRTPFLRPDGTVCVRPGYDAATRLYYDPPQGFEMPSEMTMAEAKALILDNLLVNFPFDSAASKANAVAALLLPFVRPVIQGCTPLALFTAPVRGTGKSKLTEAIAVIATGSKASLLTYTNNDEEMHKQILSLLIGGATVINMDNVRDTIRSAVLSCVLTRDMYEGRLLGRNDMRRAPQRAAWYANGNNLAVGGDNARRVYWIRIDAKRADPERRTDILHKNLEQWVLDNRARLIAACLTIAAKWYADGCPKAPSCPVVGGYEDWVRVMSGLIHYVELEGFYGNTDEMNAGADDDSSEWEHFLHAVYQKYPDGQSFLIRHVKDWIELDQGTTIPLPLEILDHLKRPNFSWRLSHAMKAQKDVIRPNGLVLVQAALDRTNVATWKVCVAHGYEPPLTVKLPRAKYEASE